MNRLMRAMRRWLPPVLLLTAVLVSVNWALRQVVRAKSFQLFGELVYRVDTNERVVALTFDDGPFPTHTEEILRTLARENVHATFYLVGREMAHNPAQTRAIITAGHELGNHSYTHQRMVLQSVDFMRDEIERTDALIRAAGYKGPITFRPPYGRKGITLPHYLQQTHRVSVTWDVEALSEARAHASPESIVGDTVRLVRPGSIILLHVMHDNRGASRLAFPAIIVALRSMGYRFLTVSQLLQKRQNR
jgi:peptidoglycan/xylan/chitin deacetylase (PgdA/CDA1 family)